MRVGYFCATPLHVLHAISLRLTVDSAGTAQLFVYNHFADAKRLVTALRQLGPFERVELIDSCTKTLWDKLQRLWHSVIPIAPVRRLLRGAFPFDKAVFFVLDALTMTQLMKRGKSCDFYYGEDGIGSYINQRLYQYSAESRLLLRLTGREKYLRRIRGIYLHQPSLRVAHRDIPAALMPSVSLSAPPMAQILQQLWPLQEDAIDTDRRGIYLREPLQELFEGAFDDLEQRIMACIHTVFTSDKVYIKPHPRMPAPLGAGRDWLTCDVPFERLMGLFDPDRSVLVSVVSTAALQPVLLGDRPPVMVFLYRLLLQPEDPLRRLWDTFFEKLRAYGKVGERVLIPDTLQQLNKTLAQAAELSGYREQYERRNA